MTGDGAGDGCCWFLPAKSGTMRSQLDVFTKP